jgi:hypothetical protein
VLLIERDVGRAGVESTPRINWQRLRPHALGVLWVIGAAIVTLAPALHHGLSLGPYDILSGNGLTRIPGATVHNTVTGDQIDEMIPWSTLAWTMVHQGHIPLWNPYSGLGLPLAFNWQSAVFSVPAVVGYAFPLHLAYTVQIVVTLVIAGTGSYALARVLGLGVIGCATAGTIYELSGSFMGWLGWPHASVMSWAGWLFAVSILIVRGRHRTRNIVAFALMLAFSIFAGEPEIFAIMAISLSIFLFSLLVLKTRRSQDQQSWLRPVGDLSLAAAAGAALSAPLALPGLQVLARSTRSSGTFLDATEVGRALPPHDIVHLLAQGYNGLPLVGNQVFGDAVYTDTAAYVGLIAIALAVLGVIRGRWRPEVVAFAVLAAVTLAIVYLPPVQALFDHIPLVQTIDWHRDLMTVGLCFAILAGVGMDVLIRAGQRRSTHLLLGGPVAVGVLLLLVLWLTAGSGLSPFDATLRRNSLEWPLITGGIALAAIAACALSSTAMPSSRFALRWFRWPAAGRFVALLLLLLETVFLVLAGAPLWSSSSQVAKPTPAVSSLLRVVGSATVGFGGFTCYGGPGSSSLGVLPESNILFGLHEFDFYDPILPRAYIRAWAATSSSTADVPIYNSFCPAFTTATQARRFGVKFVLVAQGHPGPTGAIFDRTLSDEDLYRIPDSANATLVPASGDGHLPPVGAAGTPVAAAQSQTGSLRMTTDSRTVQVLRLRLDDEPGWHATIDGRPLKLLPFSGVMIEARIPAGRHIIELHYWPTDFTIGIIVAGGALVFLVILVIASAMGYRPSRRLVGKGDIRP